MLASDEDILRKAQEWKEAGRGVALATVVETWGSAPRPVGSHLVIDGEGNFLGSVSGGCVEGDVIAEALDVIGDGGRRMLEFGVADETAWRVGLSCGGRIKVYVESVDANRADLLAAFNGERAARRPCVLVTDIASGEQRLVRATDLAADPMADILGERLRLGKSGMAAWGGKAFFLAAQTPATRLVAIGAVHIAQALAPIASLVGFDMVVVDPRTAFATPERFPDARLIAEWPEAALPLLQLDRYTAMALLTHDPRIDDQGLIRALRADCFYIGALGSSKTHAKRLDRMRAEGFGERELGRIHAPIGLDIGAVSPAEIAVAILGEIVAALRRKSLRAETEKAA
ncbi:XdhC family protein [Methylocapsa polymorpha]|uniref:XdhC family protein n=1 Tax=Methylocapsa polymorpha TaxID=3080828 RepID=A0ABZ0HYC8_9HYPH|nr:XdhC family protein [Methylocapsa sp. RX1]